MKKFFYFVVAALALGAGVSFTSCGDEDPTELNADAITVRSRVTGYVYYTYLNSSDESKKEVAPQGTVVRLEYTVPVTDAEGNASDVTLYAEAKVNNAGQYSAVLSVPASKDADVKAYVNFSAEDRKANTGTGSSAGNVATVVCEFEGTGSTTLNYGGTAVLDITAKNIGAIGEAFYETSKGEPK